MPRPQLLRVSEALLGPLSLWLVSSRQPHPQSRVPRERPIHCTQEQAPPVAILPKAPRPNTKLRIHAGVRAYYKGAFLESVPCDSVR